MEIQLDLNSTDAAANLIFKGVTFFNPQLLSDNAIRKTYYREVRGMTGGGITLATKESLTLTKISSTLHKLEVKQKPFKIIT